MCLGTGPHSGFGNGGVLLAEQSQCMLYAEIADIVRDGCMQITAEKARKVVRTDVDLFSKLCD